VLKSTEAFRTISEVADDLDVPKHVLRFWEMRFPQIRPMKRGGGRRFYRPADVELLKGIKHLLHAEGYTIKGVQKILRDQGLDGVQQCWQSGADRVAQPVSPSSVAPPAPQGKTRATIPKSRQLTAAEPLHHPAMMRSIITELEAVRDMLSAVVHPHVAKAVVVKKKATRSKAAPSPSITSLNEPLAKGKIFKSRGGR
jgi:DNA-binding transcriptional MerR regulator